jgi:MFS transporter, DHA1 family, tetracycline resistance protein
MQNRLPLIFIVITLALDAMGIGLILPVMPDLIAQIIGGSVGQAAVWGGLLATAFAVMQFVFGPVVGALSDRFGRRPVLLTSLFVMCLDYLMMAVAGSIWLLFVTRIIGGITAATYSTASAFIADITPPEKKSAAFGLVGAAFGVGFVFGPAIGGLLAEFGTRAPFYAAAALAGANLIFGYFVVPETVTDRIRRPFEWRRANPVGALLKLSELPGVTRLLVLFFIYEFAFIVYPSVWAYYTTAQFGWAPGRIGLSLALFGVGVAIVQGVLIRPALRIYGERLTIIYGICFNFSAFVVLALVTNGWVALGFIPLTALGAVVTPALQGLMSKSAADNQQGELQGVISSAKSLATMIAPLAMTQIFFAFTGPGGTFFPGAPFVLSAVLMVVCLSVFLARPHQAARSDAQGRF